MKRAAYATLIGLVGLLGISAALPHPRAARPDVAGTIELYGEGSIIIESTTAGLREVRVDARTRVYDQDVLITSAGLRPGRPATVWLATDAGNAPPLAREIMVWGR
jgi:hypothetical protein